MCLKYFSTAQKCKKLPKKAAVIRQHLPGLTHKWRGALPETSLSVSMPLKEIPEKPPGLTQVTCRTFTHTVTQDRKATTSRVTKGLRQGPAWPLLRLHCRRHGFDPWLGRSHMVQPKPNQTKLPMYISRLSPQVLEHLTWVLTCVYLCSGLPAITAACLASYLFRTSSHCRLNRSF